MPPGGVPGIPHEEILRLEEIARLSGIMAGMGIKKIRLTGGEPLVRKNVTGLVRSMHEYPEIERLAITTNGVMLPQLLPELIDAGLTNLNISIDTLDREKYQEITGFDKLEDVISGIDSAYENGMEIKLNCVPCKGLNDDEFTRLAGLSRDRKIDVRFIELMPIGQGRLFTGISSKEILEQLEAEYGKATELPYMGEGPAQYFAFEGFKGRVGFISPISHKFCADCNRLRLTSDGRLKLCLYYKDGVDLKGPLREGASDEEIQELVKKAIYMKPKEHCFGEADVQDTELKRMNQIGG